MSNKKKTQSKGKSFSVADILMVIGFMTLAFTTFLGSKLLYGDLIRAAFTMLLIVLLTALFLWLLCTAKKAQNHRRNWMIVEAVSLVIFVVFFLTVTGESRHFMYVFENKTELSKKAQEDCDKMINLFEKYEQQEKAHISKIKESINSIPPHVTVYADSETKSRLKQWKGKHTIKSGRSYWPESIKAAANDYEKVLKGLLLGDDYATFREEYKRKINKIVSSVDKGADYDEYYEDARLFCEYYEDIAKELTRLSNLPQKYNLTNRNGTLRSEMLSHKYEANEQDLGLPEYFNGVKQSTAIGWILTCGMLFFILCAYFATSRSRRVTVLSGGFLKGRKNLTNDGGIDLC